MNKIYHTPYLIFNLGQLKRNIIAMEDMKNFYKLIYVFPIKAFNCPKVLKIFKDNDFWFDVSNLNEYNSVKHYVTSNNKIIFNNIKNQNIYNKNIINVRNYYDGSNNCIYNGVRINFNDVIGKVSRFGISSSVLMESQDQFSDIKLIHFHVAHKKNKEMLDKIADNIRHFTKLYKNLEYIDIGGNWSMEQLDLLKYFLRKLRHIVGEDIVILIEAGDFWFYNVGFAKATVIGINKEENTFRYTLDLSKTLHCSWSDPKMIYSESNDLSNADKKHEYYGPTCYELDKFDSEENYHAKIGEVITFRNINGYSYELNKNFNGINKAAVRFIDE